MQMHDVEVKCGDRFGRCMILDVGIIHHEHSGAVCMCDCGRSFKALISRLRSGSTRSCGKGKCRFNSKTGLSKHPEYVLTYNSWKSMIGRCTNPNKSQYKHYGARGICVCKEWKDFGVFLADMGKRPSRRHTIDRIDNSGNYEPTNCKWSTPCEQTRNRSITVTITHNGITKTVKEWSEALNVRSSMLYQRISNGWNDSSEILHTPSLRPYKPRQIDISDTLKLFGQTK